MDKEVYNGDEGCIADILKTLLIVPQKVLYPTCTELVQQRRLLILKNLYHLIFGIKCTVKTKVRIVGRKSRKGNWKFHLNALFDFWFVIRVTHDVCIFLTVSILLNVI